MNNTLRIRLIILLIFLGHWNWTHSQCATMLVLRTHFEKVLHWKLRSKTLTADECSQCSIYCSLNAHILVVPGHAQPRSQALSSHGPREMKEPGNEVGSCTVDKLLLACCLFRSLTEDCNSSTSGASYRKYKQYIILYIHVSFHKICYMTDRCWNTVNTTVQGCEHQPVGLSMLLLLPFP